MFTEVYLELNRNIYDGAFFEKIVNGSSRTALQEWHQNTRSCKSLFQQILIVYKKLTVSTWDHCLLSGPKSGCLILV